MQGLAALLVQGLSDCVPADVLGVDPGAIIDALGLKQKLTPSRNNGFLNMFRLMQQKAAQLSGQVHTCQISLACYTRGQTFKFLKLLAMLA